MKKTDFNYLLPTALIAQYPLSSRGAGRLLCLDRVSGEIADKQFSDFLGLINSNDLLVLNDTKVIPARLFAHKLTGGKVEILIERLTSHDHAVAHIRASKAPKAGCILQLEKGYQVHVTGRENDLFHIQFLNAKASTVLDQIGHMPLPPYITRVDDASDLSRYQTVFAKQAGAVAAPTAGLHFDAALLDQIHAKGVATAFVTLHVGSGTFQPVRVLNLAEHLMHKEYYAVSEATVEAVTATRERGGRVIAIGTTAVRALESASATGQLRAGFGDTDLFITPGYRFQSVDALLTNFHLPESTLLMLVSAFAGYPAVMNAYQHAIKESYRFFSYGDAMFIST